jgi:hypothetical protein
MNDASPMGASSYQSGAIEIDAMQRRVLIDGKPAKVGGRAFDVLLALGGATRPGGTQARANGSGVAYARGRGK